MSEITIKKIIKAFVPYGIIWLHSVYNRKKQILLRRREQRTLQRVEVYLVDHCNLKCAGCGVFSPLAGDKYLDISMYQRDCQRLSELTGGGIEVIRLVGGEPTLHPKLPDICAVTREYFKISKIQMVTNGILLSKKEDAFWKMCKEHKIDIQISEYPITINIAKILEKASLHDVVIEFTGTKTNSMWRMKLDIEGKQDAEKSFKKCWMGNTCVTISGGRLYTCGIMTHIEHFNKYFNTDLQVGESDSIDIYKVKNIREVLKFLCKPIPFCRYCDMKGMSYGHKWQISKKDLKEWT
ncbi:MAG: radical SAM protein [Dysgonamonadaceae bacterium]|jgi:MoaA/NifB/PqqE/SkfB family radical SAM enzyme|nr:radical SAM protein [Dysgonamonadaceae bacterium]